MKNFKPCGNQVLVRWIPLVKDTEEAKSPSGLILPDGVTSSNIGGKQIEANEMAFQVVAVGSEVDLEEVDFKIGDLVVFNEHDAKYLENDKGEFFHLTRSVSIMGTYETGQKPKLGWDLEKY